MVKCVTPDDWHGAKIATITEMDYPNEEPDAICLMKWLGQRGYSVMIRWDAMPEKAGHFTLAIERGFLTERMDTDDPVSVLATWAFRAGL